MPLWCPSVYVQLDLLQGLPLLLAAHEAALLAGPESVQADPHGTSEPWELGCLLLARLTSL